MIEKIENKDIQHLIELAVKEDISSGDITSNAIFNLQDRSRAVIISKEEGIFCGRDPLILTYSYIDKNINVSVKVDDGDSVTVGSEIAIIEGPTINILSGERIALNFIQRMSGIASKTHRFVNLVKNTNIKILDTRKTLPGFRLLDKYAVKTGGGTNHRFGLFDMVMIKDNHIKAAGSIAQAVAMIRKKYGTQFKVEVETTNVKEVSEALSAGADIIMLDNMVKEQIIESVSIINKQAQIEVSGNMDEKKIIDIRDCDVNFISLGTLTHSVKAFDFSMKFNQE